MIRQLVARTLVCCAAAAVGMVSVTTWGASRAELATPAPSTSTVSPAAQGTTRVTVLLEEHGCWSGAAPAGAPIPSHAVVTTEDGRTRYVAASIGFGIWLDGDPGTLHGFCP